MTAASLARAPCREGVLLRCSLCKQAQQLSKPGQGTDQHSLLLGKSMCRLAAAKEKVPCIGELFLMRSLSKQTQGFSRQRQICHHQGSHHPGAAMM